MPDAPLRCLLCDATGPIRAAGFTQQYAQRDAPPVPVSWWACRACGGLSAHPVPAPAAIEKHWGGVAYADPRQEELISARKHELMQRILAGLDRRVGRGALLDFGCSFGAFLAMARDAGWAPQGFDACGEAVETCRARGFSVRRGWELTGADFGEAEFAAVVANDVLCYSWHLQATLRALHRVLRPGGVLAMRLSNKNQAVRLACALVPAGPRRDTLVSRMLQGQFHSTSVGAFARVLRGVGFSLVEDDGSAPTAPWEASGWITRLTYLGAEAAYQASGGRVNVYPGVLVFARK
jgi:SAM-dependent methyltransferase